MTPFRKTLLAVCSVAFATLMRATPVPFDLPAGPASSTVVTFAKQAAAEVLFSASDLKKIQTPPVVGLYEPEAALALLLQGTGLRATRDAGGKFVVERKPGRPESGEVRGVIMSRDDRPIAAATVRLEGGTAATRSGTNGAFVLTGVPVAPQTLVIQADGYRTLRVAEIAVRAGRRMELNTVRLSPLDENGAQQLEEVTVNAADLGAVPMLKDFIVTPSRFGIADERLTPEVTLTKDELEKLPQIGDDLYRTITRLPGLSGDDHSAAFWVRGAPNDQVLTRFDGVDLIEPFHLRDSDDALSIIDLGTVGSIDLMTGGFTTEYGDHLAGVMNMETEADPGAASRTTLALTITNASATNQGEFANGDGQWLIDARHGYLGLVFKLQPGLGNASPDYYDLSSKVEYKLTPNQTLSVHGLYARDSSTLPGGAEEPALRSTYDSAYGWARWQGNFGDRVSGEAVLSYSHLDWNRQGDGLFDGGTHPFILRDRRSLDIAGLRQDWTVDLTEHALLRTGFEFKAEDAGYDYSLFQQTLALNNGAFTTATRRVNAVLRPDGDYQAAYVASRWQPWTSLVIEPGVRFEHTTSTGDSGVEPRLNAALTFGRTTLRAAWGRYEQAEGLQDISVQDGETTLHAPERAEQRVLSLSHRLESGINLRAEAYERLSSHLRPHWENPADPYDRFPELNFQSRTKLNPTQGRARGVELSAEHRGEGRFGWGASYTYAATEELIGAEWVPRTRDQRQTFYTDVTYAAAHNWQLSAAWQFHTGWPTTPVNYTLVPLTNGTFAASPHYGPINSTRAQDYQRLDLRVTRTFRLPHGTLRAFVDVFNAYDAPNAYGVQNQVIINSGKLSVLQTPNKDPGRGAGLPILPNAGISWEF